MLLFNLKKTTKKKNINQRFSIKKPYQKSILYHEYQNNILFRYVFIRKLKPPCLENKKYHFDILTVCHLIF